jgi:hypothetical protein
MNPTHRPVGPTARLASWPAWPRCWRRSRPGPPLSRRHCERARPGGSSAYSCPGGCHRFRPTGTSTRHCPAPPTSAPPWPTACPAGWPPLPGGMRPGPARRGTIADSRADTRHREHPRSLGRDGRAAGAGRRAARGAVPGACLPAPRRPAAARPAHRRSTGPYATISAELGIPVGSIGPTRARCLDKPRRHPALAALIHAPAENLEREPRPQPNSEKRCLRLPVQSCRRAIRAG